MSNEIFENSELSQAAYADLSLLVRSTDFYLEQFVEADITEDQFNSFAQRFPEIVTQVIENTTGFSATVFKDTTTLTGDLTIAFRGTEFGLLDFGSDVVLATEGAAFGQIISMYNWWQMVSGTPGQSVNSIQGFTSGVDTLSSNAVHVLGQYYYLVPDSAVATGVPGSSGPVSILSLDTDAKLNVTGHSLGGHLALAFKMLFPDVVDKGFTYNSPGIGINAVTQAFFSSLNGSLLSNTPENFQHVIGSEVADGDPFYATAGLHFTEAEREAAIHVAIEDQVPGESIPWPWGNHSIVVLTDALAVYDLITELDSTLSADEFHDIFQQSSNQTFDSLESIVSSIASLFGVSGAALPPGNDHRNDLYLKMAAIGDDPGFQLAAAQNSGFAFFREGNIAETAKNDFGYFLRFNISRHSYSQRTTNCFSNWIPPFTRRGVTENSRMHICKTDQCFATRSCRQTLLTLNTRLRSPG